MEENRERLSDFAQRHGLTEDEARIFEHLNEAATLYGELPDNYDTDVQAWMNKTHEMYRLLMWRVVKRDHPEGWRTIAESEDSERGEVGEEPI